MAVLSLKFKVVTSFLTSLVAGFVAGQRTDGSERVRRKVAASVAGLAGLLVGFVLADKLDSGTEDDRR